MATDPDDPARPAPPPPDWLDGDWRDGVQALAESAGIAVPPRRAPRPRPAPPAPPRPPIAADWLDTAPPIAWTDEVGPLAGRGQPAVPRRAPDLAARQAAWEAAPVARGPLAALEPQARAQPRPGPRWTPEPAPVDPAERRITAVLGPTNTGKTHYALERMLARASGIIGLPLRLLAREVYDRIVALRGPGAVALITGEEKIQPASAQYYICTVEAMPLDRAADFVAIDEIQLAADPERGHIFTDRLLNARGRYETLFMGSDTMRPRIASLVPEARFLTRERYSTLTHTGVRKLSRLRPRTAVVAFSAEQVYAIAELIRRQRGGAAVVMGALSPRTRNAQVALYQNGDVDYLVATDAIGMGLNMDVDHVAFAGLTKFDGRRARALEPSELAQIAGRAGRFTDNGTFGTTGEAGPMDAEVIEAIESHRFRPLTRLMWRNGDLQFGTVPALVESLEQNPLSPDLVRVRDSDDLIALRGLWADPEVQALARGGEAVRALWEVAQTPDFRKTAAPEHIALLARIYQFLRTGSGVIPSAWMAAQVQRLDRVDGDIDTLSKRLAYIRTWTYVAHRGRWLDDPEGWRETTRAVEDRLSDALHVGLTQRFVDRRTSVLIRRLKQKERLVAEVDDKGSVSVSGEFVGRLDGFRFTADPAAAGEELKTLRSASLAGLQAELARRADKLYLSPDSELDVTEQGGLMWGQDAIGRLEKGDQPLVPRIRVFVDELAEPAVTEKVERRLTHWVTRRINALFEPVIKMRDDEAVTGLARGVAFQLAEAMGVIPRRQIGDDIKALAQDERALLRKHGVRFGQHTIFLPLMLKPAPTRLRLILWSLWEGFEVFPEAPPPGHVTLPAIPGVPHGYYERAGYKLCGGRAVRIDMLERLADLIRPLDLKAGFEASPEMLSITGCTLDQLAEVLKGLGFEATRGERPKEARPVSPRRGAKGAKPEAAPAASDSAGATAADREAGVAPVGAAEQTADVSAAPIATVEAELAASGAAAEPMAPESAAPNAAMEPESAAFVAPAEPVAPNAAMEPESAAFVAPAEPTVPDAAVEPESAAFVAPAEPVVPEAAFVAPAEPVVPEAAAAEPEASAREATAEPVAASEPEAVASEAAMPVEVMPVEAAPVEAAPEPAEAGAAAGSAEPAPAATGEMEVFFTFALRPRRAPPTVNPGRRPEGEARGAPRGDGARRPDPARSPRPAPRTEPVAAVAAPDTPPTTAEAPPPAPQAEPRRDGERRDGERRDRSGPKPDTRRSAPTTEAGTRRPSGPHSGPPPGKGGPKGGERDRDRGPREKPGQEPVRYSASPEPRRDGKPVDPDSPFAILAQLKKT